MSSRWWPSLAVCAFVLAVIAVASNFDRDTTDAAATLPAAQQQYALAAVSAPPSASATKTTAASYVGNTNTHKFHRNTCRYAGCPNCTARYGTREEAIAAGYRPCGICDP